MVADPAGRSLADTFAGTVIEHLPNPTHPVVVIVPSHWGPDGESLTDSSHIGEVAARLGAIDDVFELVAPLFYGYVAERTVWRSAGGADRGIMGRRMSLTP